MTLDELMDQCIQAGVTIVVRGDTVRLRGDGGAVQKFAPLLRPHKAAIIADANGQIDELMESDGLTRDEAIALVESWFRPRPAVDWLAMIAELDQLIDRYCAAAHLSQEAAARIKAARDIQAIASIPESLSWFRRALSVPLVWKLSS